MTSELGTRGRKSLPLDKKKPPQATVKINNFILPFVKELKGNLKKGLVTEKTLSLLFGALKEKGEQQLSVFKDPDTVSLISDLQEKIRLVEAEKQIIELKFKTKDELNIKFIQERDKEHLKAVHAESKVESLKSSYRLLKNTHDELLHREYDCMAMTGTGNRCTKPAKLDEVKNGLMIHVCLQHSKLISDEKK
jgi:hypothetical protein